MLHVKNFLITSIIIKNNNKIKVDGYINQIIKIVID